MDTIKPRNFVALDLDMLLEQTIGQITSGWKLDDIRRGLRKARCSPEEIEQIIKSAKAAVASNNRAQGRWSFVIGILCIIAAILVIAFQISILGFKTILAPAGLFLFGVVACVRGLLKGVFG